MATVTPNFNWPVPTSTDLVKDGATAIEALGDSIDASLVDLKGGTTGQVLSKTSGTDMDFTWVTTDDANAIQNSIVDAKGDLISATANDTPARLAVGANGETLVADSSTSTGLRYQVPVNANPVLNSAMQIWQRGTSLGAANSQYIADRWNFYRAGYAAGITVSRQATNDTTNLPFIQYCSRVQRDSGNTNTGNLQYQQSFETVNSIPYAGKTVTLSFYARAGANYSPTSSLLVVQLFTGTGTDEALRNGFTGVQIPINTNATLTTTWQRFTYTATLATNITQIGLSFLSNPTGTAGANDFFELTGVQLENGSVATPFKTYAGTIQGELAACQRYYYRQTATLNAYTRFGTGVGTGSTNVRNVISLPVTMRTGPSSIDFANIGIDGYGTGLTAISAMTFDATGPTVICVDAASTGVTQYKVYSLCANNNTSAYLGFSAEL